MPVPLIVVAIIEAGAAIAARKVAQELAKKAATELAKKAAAEVAKKAAAEAAKKAATEAAKKAAIEATKKAASQTAKTAAKRGNSPLNKYLDKAKEKLSKACKKAVEKYGAHIHGKKGDVIKAGSKTESNHIIQNAMLEDARGKGSSICPGYKASRAPSMPLGKDAHDITTADQRVNSQGHRDAGSQPTYSEARDRAKKQVEKTGVNKKDAECIMKFTDEVFRQLCPDLVDKNQKLRTPKR